MNGFEDPNPATEAGDPAADTAADAEQPTPPDLAADWTAASAEFGASIRQINTARHTDDEAAKAVDAHREEMARAEMVKAAAATSLQTTKEQSAAAADRVIGVLRAWKASLA